MERGAVRGHAGGSGIAGDGFYAPVARFSGDRLRSDRAVEEVGRSGVGVRVQREGSVADFCEQPSGGVAGGDPLRV